ncbi:proline-rich protein HaeIII subfamily 1-like, partial [Brachyistius frenatus]|uniref:proline-rich protein HaeIII subfamily 1-like n=1 Tax=Brachyistius frenatus TaxID=100188 RepID=UPI0037E8345E
CQAQPRRPTGAPRGQRGPPAGAAPGEIREKGPRPGSRVARRPPYPAPTAPGLPRSDGHHPAKTHARRPRGGAGDGGPPRGGPPPPRFPSGGEGRAAGRLLPQPRLEPTPRFAPQPKCPSP